MRSGGRVVLLCLCSAGLWAQDNAPPLDSRLAKLPIELRQHGTTLLKETNVRALNPAVQALLKNPAASTDFLISLLDGESSAAARGAIVDRLGRINQPAVRQALQRRAASDEDPKIAVLALERLTALNHGNMLRLLDRRLKMARESGNEADRRWLLGEQERWLNLSRSARIPAFMQAPPPPFTVKPAGQPVRVLAFGDYGQGARFQQQTAAAMFQYHRGHPFDFAITLGDNFYPRGMESPSDPRWKTWWDELYNPLGIPFYISLGNHDWGQPDSPAAEYIYSLKSPSWRMPAMRYTFTAGPVQFFAIDSQGTSEAQWLWLDDELKKSEARWKIVYGHHPIYSHGAHGDTPALIRDLLPILQGRVDAYFAGHEHDLQHVKPEGNVHLFIAGGGGAGIRPISPGPRNLFAASSYGFAVLDVDAQSLRVSFIDQQLKPLYEYTIRK